MTVYCAAGHSHRQPGCDACGVIERDAASGLCRRCACNPIPSCAICAACPCRRYVGAVSRVLVGIDGTYGVTFVYADARPQHLGLLASLREKLGAWLAPAVAPQ